MSRLYSNGNQSVLSWVEVDDSVATLKYSLLDENKWSLPTKVYSGSNWFNNWADYPSVLVDGDKVRAHWLEKTNSGKYDYRVRITYSEDGGKSWGQPFTPHSDGVDAEHGFVSMQPNGQETFITWLDGRNTKSPSEHDGDHHNHHGHGGAMTLRAAMFQDGKVTQEWLLDERVCDCCTTAAATTDEGMIVAYRDRSDDEIRDISIQRLVEGKWLPAENVPQDNWEIAGCPVNGPSIAAAGNKVALTWFTAPDEQPQVKLAISLDNGKTFGNGVTISEKTIGRVDTVIHNDHIIVSYLAVNAGKAELKVDRYGFDGVRVDSNTLDILSLDRNTGFPTLGIHNGKVLVSWNKDTVYTAQLDYSH
ncbi:exo-alpha-sialidase [Vibrio coralliilyticus]|nr:exo-alpha-sialidase [Vibrio coralliilyticus]